MKKLRSRLEQRMKCNRWKETQMAYYGKYRSKDLSYISETLNTTTPTAHKGTHEYNQPSKTQKFRFLKIHLGEPTSNPSKVYSVSLVSVMLSLVLNNMIGFSAWEPVLRIIIFLMITVVVSAMLVYPIHPSLAVEFVMVNRCRFLSRKIHLTLEIPFARKKTPITATLIDKQHDNEKEIELQSYISMLKDMPGDKLYFKAVGDYILRTRTSLMEDNQLHYNNLTSEQRWFMDSCLKNIFELYEAYLKALPGLNNDKKLRDELQEKTSATLKRTTEVLRRINKEKEETLIDKAALMTEFIDATLKRVESENLFDNQRT